MIRKARPAWGLTSTHEAKVEHHTCVEVMSKLLYGFDGTGAWGCLIIGSDAQQGRESQRQGREHGNYVAGQGGVSVGVLPHARTLFLIE